MKKKFSNLALLSMKEMKCQNKHLCFKTTYYPITKTAHVLNEIFSTLENFPIIHTLLVPTEIYLLDKL